MTTLGARVLPYSDHHAWRCRYARHSRRFVRGQLIFQSGNLELERVPSKACLTGEPVRAHVISGPD